MSSILEESKKSRSGGFFKITKIKTLLAVIIILVSIAVYFNFSKEEAKDVVVVKKEWTVKKDDLKISIEADGKVVAEDGVELSFSVNDDNLEVKEVFVSEGDKVKRGDKIATVKTENLELNVKNAYSSYLSTLADYNEIMDGATTDQISRAKDNITSAEISLNQSKISLEDVKQSNEERIQAIKDDIYDMEEDLEDAEEEVNDKDQDELNDEEIVEAYEDSVGLIKSINISLSTILNDSDEIVGVDKDYLNDSFENLLGVKKASSLTAAKSSYSSARDELDILDSLVVLLKLDSSYEEIDLASNQVSLTLHEFEKHLYDMKLMLEQTISSYDFTQTDLDDFINKISSNRSSVNSSITGINAQNKKIKDAEEDYDDAKEDIEDGNSDDIDNYNDIKKELDNLRRDLANAEIENQRNVENAEESLRSRELSLEQVKRDYDDLIAPLTESESASAKSRLMSSSVNLEKTQIDLENAIITSPIDGEIAMLNYKAGDIIVDSSNSDPVVTIINNDTLFIEVNIEEADINKIKKNQTAYVTFDSLNELKLDGEVSYISLTSKTDNSGIVTYLVRIVILNKEDVQIREGMTAFVDFVTAEARDVLVVPVDAVSNVDNKPSVMNDNNEWLPVITGFTDGKYVEIIEGLNSKDKIVY